MGKIMLFGSKDVTCIPSDMSAWMNEYMKQGHTFITRDRGGIDTVFHRKISSIGADAQSEIYCMSYARTNKYDLPTVIYESVYNSESKQLTIKSNNSTDEFIIAGIENEIDIPVTREYYEFIDRQMIKDCDIALGILNSADENKAELHIIQLLNIFNKPCYIFNV